MSLCPSPQLIPLLPCLLEIYLTDTFAIGAQMNFLLLTSSIAIDALEINTSVFYAFLFAYSQSTTDASFPCRKR